MDAPKSLTSITEHLEAINYHINNIGNKKEAVLIYKEEIVKVALKILNVAKAEQTQNPEDIKALSKTIEATKQLLEKKKIDFSEGIEELEKIKNTLVIKEKTESVAAGTLPQPETRPPTSLEPAVAKSTSQSPTTIKSTVTKPLPDKSSDEEDPSESLPKEPAVASPPAESTSSKKAEYQTNKKELKREARGEIISKAQIEFDDHVNIAGIEGRITALKSILVTIGKPRDLGEKELKFKVQLALARSEFLRAIQNEETNHSTNIRKLIKTISKIRDKGNDVIKSKATDLIEILQNHISELENYQNPQKNPKKLLSLSKELLSKFPQWQTAKASSDQEGVNKAISESEMATRQFLSQFFAVLKDTQISKIESAKTKFENTTETETKEIIDSVKDIFLKKETLHLIPAHEINKFIILAGEYYSKDSTEYQSLLKLQNKLHILNRVEVFANITKSPNIQIEAIDKKNEIKQLTQIKDDLIKKIADETPSEAKGNSGEKKALTPDEIKLTQIEARLAKLIAQSEANIAKHPKKYAALLRERDRSIADAADALSKTVKFMPTTFQTTVDAAGTIDDVIVPNRKLEPVLIELYNTELSHLSKLQALHQYLMFIKNNKKYGSEAEKAREEKQLDELLAIVESGMVFSKKLILGFKAGMHIPEEANKRIDQCKSANIPIICNSFQNAQYDLFVAIPKAKIALDELAPDIDATNISTQIEQLKESIENTYFSSKLEATQKKLIKERTQRKALFEQFVQQNTSLKPEDPNKIDQGHINNMAGATLNNLVITLVQRPTKYPLLLTEMLKSGSLNEDQTKMLQMTLDDIKFAMGTAQTLIEQK